MSISDDQTILARTAITQDMLACPLHACPFFIAVPAVPVSEGIANALGMTGRGLAQLHADRAAYEAARKMRTHLQGHSVEDWLTRYPGLNS